MVDVAEYPQIKITNQRTWARWDLELIQGDGWRMKLRFKDASGVVIDKSDFSYSATMRRRVDDLEGFSVGVDISRAHVGEVALTLEADQTRAMARRMVWDLQEIEPGGVPKTRLRGGVVVEREVTV